MTGEVLRGEVVDLGGGAGRPPDPPDPPRARDTGDRRGGPNRQGLLVGLGVAAVLLLVVGAVLVTRRTNDDAAPVTPPGQAEAQAFLAAWSSGDTVKMQSLVSDPTADVARDLTAGTAGLHLVSSDVRFESMDPAPAPPAAAAARFRADLVLRGLGPWTYAGVLPLVATPAGYRVAWSPAVVHPALKPGLVLDRTRAQADRAPILGDKGQPLVAPRPTVTIGLWPAHVKDRAQVKAVLAATLHVDPTSIDRKLDAPGLPPDQLVPVITISRESYNALRSQIHEIPGLNFVEGTTRAPPVPGFAAQILGRTGPITAEQLTKLGPLYQQGDTVGMSGLEAQYESRLAGSPSGDVRVVDPTGAVVEQLQHIAGTAPQPVRTTLDAGVQGAAERALADVTGAGALVAVDRDGQIRAAVSLPLTEEFDRALLGQYPPGSTFKVVTTDALLGNGLTASSPTECPATLTVDGKVFHNAEAESRSSLSLADAFALSCNTSFIGAARALPPDALAQAATRFGFGAAPDLGLPSAGGAFPPPRDATSAAAAAIGQGQVVASPLQMATVAQTVMVGERRSPSLVTDPPPGGAGTAGSAAPPPPAPLAPANRDALDSMMHLVVQRGTGTRAAERGTDVAGKTGTAEFGADTPPRTHAWFVGYDGTLAVAVVVEGAGFGGDVAAPIAARFFGS